MATRTQRLRPAVMHRQYEPVCRHLCRQRRAAGTTRRRRHYRRARRSRVPSPQRLGRGWHGEWEAMSVDVSRLGWSFMHQRRGQNPGSCIGDGWLTARSIDNSLRTIQVYISCSFLVFGSSHIVLVFVFWTTRTPKNLRRKMIGPMSGPIDVT